MSENRLDYKNSGVDIDEGNRFVSVIKKRRWSPPITKMYSAVSAVSQDFF